MFLGQATGLSTLQVQEQECTETCPGDTPDGPCSPVCHFCSCCAGPRTIAPMATTMPVFPPSSEAALSGCEQVPLSPEPGDIFHVPKSLLA